MGFMEHMNGQVLNAHEKADKMVALLAEQNALLAQVVENVEAQGLRDVSRRIPIQDVADANGVSTLRLQVPQGIAWNLVSLAFSSPAAVGQVNVYLGTNDPTNLIWSTAGAIRGAFMFAADEYVPQGGVVVIEFTGQAAGVVCTANLKVQNLTER